MGKAVYQQRTLISGSERDAKFVEDRFLPIPI